MRRFFGLCVGALTVLTTALAVGGCSKEAPVNRVGVNVVDKEIFQGSWYYARTVIDVDYEAAGIGTFPGDAAMDFGAFPTFAALPRIRWVIDEDTLFAYRDYELLEETKPASEEDSEDLGHPVAAFAIEKHFDITREYNPTTGEERNVLVENDADLKWYERQYMRVDWSKNLLPGYYGQTANLYELIGLYNREPADLYIQNQSDFPDSWQPQFHRMSCAGLEDDSCEGGDRDWASDYEQGELYSMSFVTQELMSPGNVPDPFTGRPVQFCQSIYFDAPNCATVAVYVRNSFLKVSDQRQYEPENWTDSRFDQAGYFRLQRETYDRQTAAGDPGHRRTDFINYNINRHNIWLDWVDEAGEPVPYEDRRVRPVIWYSTPELPAHLVKPSFKLVGEWNRVMMETVRQLKGGESASYPRVECQTADPDAYCYCTEGPDGELLNPTCAGRYDPFETPDEAASRGVENPYQCWVDVPEGAEPEMGDDAIAARLNDESFYDWFGAEMQGDECVNVLRVNDCNRATIAENGGTREGLTCQERGDARFKFLSYVDQPGTRFLGIATMRSDPVTGEIIVGDANIGGPALDSYRTFALQQYDLMKGDTSAFEIITGEDVRGYLESLGEVHRPAPPRVDFNEALRRDERFAERTRRRIDDKMQRFYDKAQRLKGPEGRANTFIDERRAAIAGSAFERRVMENADTLALAGITRLPEGVSPEDITEEILDETSPFRRPAHELLADMAERDNELSMANVMMPNEFTDWSVLEFVERHQDWPRARVELAVNRLLYYETQLHEMGHTLGLRHMFGASADSDNYFDDYYLIDERIPMPDPRDFDEDGTPGLSVEEQRAYEDAYQEAKEKRELAGIDRWQNSSIMEYTSQWYHRTNSRAGRYDEHAVAFGYGDLIEVYDNAATRPLDEITPVNTDRSWFKYYHGGETCDLDVGDSSCPYATGGARAGDLLQTNRDVGLTQRCVPNAFADEAPDTPNGICTNFHDDLDAMNDGDSAPRWAPVSYRFCSDERVGTYGWCHRFDEGDNYREIVQNIWDQYERDYIFTHFRRYRREFSFSSVFSRLISRKFNILQSIFQNMLYKYANDPEFRTDPGPFGFYDQFMASADVLNLYARILGQPDVGSYRWNRGWQRYERSNRDPDSPGADLRVDVGKGRYMFSRYQRGLTAIDPTDQSPVGNRIERVGTYVDKNIALQMLTMRGWQPAYARDVPFYTNFYDLFPIELQQIFQGMIQNQPEAYMPRVICDNFPDDCEDPRIVYMDFYRGDCREEESCRPHPTEETYAELPLLNGGGFFLLQTIGTMYALSEFPVFFDTTFQNQVFICVEGQGDCHSPSPDAEDDRDFVRYTSTRYGKNFLAWQVEPTQAVPNQRSIGFSMVTEAKESSIIIEALRAYRGDFGGEAYTLDNLSDDQVDDLDRIDYEIPGSNDQVDNEIDRLDSRLRSLESFFFWLIQLERQIGIADWRL